MASSKGTGPRNLTRSGIGPQPRMPRAKASRASIPRMNPARATAGVGRPPAGAGSGIAKATSPMASTPKKTINKPKTGHPGNSRRLAKPKADFPSKI